MVNHLRTHLPKKGRPTTSTVQDMFLLITRPLNSCTGACISFNLWSPISRKKGRPKSYYNVANCARHVSAKYRASNSCTGARINGPHLLKKGRPYLITMSPTVQDMFSLNTEPLTAALEHASVSIMAVWVNRATRIASQHMTPNKIGKCFLVILYHSQTPS